MKDRIRLHRNLVVAAQSGLHEICFGERPADKVVERLLKSDTRWGARDRAFIAETIYELVRFLRRYLQLSGTSELSPSALYPMMGVWLDEADYDLRGFPEFEGLPSREKRERWAKDLKEHRAIWESVPDWLDQHLVLRLGSEKWTQELRALNQPADMVLRLNRLRADELQLVELLDTQAIPYRTEPELPDAYTLGRKSNVFALDAFKKGWFEMQDGSSQRVGHFTQVEAGMRVIDACAGAGGKTLHLASLMNNTGRIIALDIYDNKLTELMRRARRAGAQNIESRLIDSTKVIKRLHQQADRVLLDAPCTGLGVLRRNPDTKWKLRPEFLPEVIDLQRRILMDYSKMVRVGGKLVYATCSILPEENEQQIEAFLCSPAGSGFELEESRHCWPSVDGFDGFYMARLSRVSLGVATPSVQEAPEAE